MKATVISTIISLIIFPQIATAYQINYTNNNNPVKWHKEIVQYTLRANAPRGITLNHTEDAVITSFETWNQVLGTSFTFEYTGRSRNTGIGFDSTPGAINENVVTWENENWEYDSHALAVTIKTFESSTGKIVDADIIVNGMQFTWGMEGSPNTHDIQNTLTHEIGHFLGLEHADIPEATMYASAVIGETSKRELHSDDMMGMRSLYPGNLQEIPTTESFDNSESESTNSYQDGDFTESGIKLDEVNFHLSCQTTMENTGVTPTALLIILLGLGAMVIIRRK